MLVAAAPQPAAEVDGRLAIRSPKKHHHHHRKHNKNLGGAAPAAIAVPVAPAPA
jgi:hypothetical protein